jgi:hypothetical protein
MGGGTTAQRVVDVHEVADEVVRESSRGSATAPLLVNSGAVTVAVQTSESLCRPSRRVPPTAAPTRQG